MDEDSIGLAVEKREGWAFCVTCQRGAPPGSEIIHQSWCPPYEPPSRWERFVKFFDEVNVALIVACVAVPLILWGSWELWRIFINYMVECPCL